MFPPDFIDEPAGLQDNIPPAPWEEIQAAIEAELGRPLAELLLIVDPTPIASASLGQVYAALLPDRTEVIIKVQRPNKEWVRRDVGKVYVQMFDVALLRACLECDVRFACHGITPQCYSGGPDGEAAGRMPNAAAAAMASRRVCTPNFW
jgi:hypothetical protein